MIKLRKLGHILVRVSNLSCSIKFYRDLLGMELIETNSEGHNKMAFLTFGDSGHDIDLLEVPAGNLSPAESSTLHHVAFQVDSFNDLHNAYFHFEDHGIKIIKATDHLNQKSIYIKDPDGNIIEIYHELDRSLEMFRKGRYDEDKELVFER